MFDFLYRLVDTSGFPARWYCGDWTAAHGWLHILSDLGVFSAYVAIPCVLAYFILHRKDLPFPAIFWLFGAFILACGTTHLMEALMFWWPAYRLMGVLKLATAVVSWLTVLALVPVVPKVLALRSPRELEEEIKGRQRVEQNLRLSEERFRRLVEGVQDYSVFLLDPQGYIASWNVGAERTKGYRAEEIIGQHFSRFYSAEDIRQGKPDRGLATARAVGRCEDEGWRVRKDGSKFWAHVVITALKNDAGQIQGFSKFTRDLTERKRAEDALREAHDKLEKRVEERTADLAKVNADLRSEISERQRAEAALRASEARFRLLANAMPQLAWTARSDGHIDWYNQRWYDYTGTTPQQMEGWGWQSVHDPAVLPKVLTRWKAAIASGTAFDMVFPLRGADGRFRSFLTQVMPLRGAEGQVLQWIGTNTDVTERTQMEEALRQAHAELEERVRARTAELSQKNVELQAEIEERRRAEQTLHELTAELKRSNAELDQFAAVASHDLQEPLRKIQAFGDRLQARCSDMVGEQGRQYIERMQSSAARMQTLIGDLLNFSRITTKARASVPVDLAAEARRVVADLETRIHQTGGRVELGALPTVYADPTQMRQLLQNLIGNALKFHRPGIAPVVRVEGEQLDHPAGGDNDRPGGGPVVQITVRDNGIGFEEAYLDRIFQIFQRLHGRDEYEGTGIGLAICRKIVERHGGTITAQSVPGAGATFLVTLPLQPTPAEKAR